MINRSSLANIAADLAAVAALRAARFALRLMPQRTFFASAFAFAHALSAATTAHFAAITAASQAKFASARSVLALALRRAVNAASCGEGIDPGTPPGELSFRGPALGEFRGAL